jgi:WG containing repeat
MKTILLSASILLAIFLFSCASSKYEKYYEVVDYNPTDTLFLKSDGSYSFYYVNTKGEKVPELGRFAHAYTDTFVTFGIVEHQYSERFDHFAVNQNGERIFDIFLDYVNRKNYDKHSGNDKISDGLFRINQNGLIGYADSSGRIIIEPQFEWAYPFKNGKAKVTFECYFQYDWIEKSHLKIVSDTWFYIDKAGKRISK